MAPLMKVNPEALRAQRIRARLSTNELAAATGVSQSTIENIEGGRQGRNHMDTARRLADGLGMELADLIVFAERARAEEVA